MSTTRRPVSLNVILVVLVLGLVAFVLYFYFFVNPAQVVGILSRTDLVFYAGAFVCYFLFGFFAALAWRSLLGNLSLSVSVRKAFLFTWVGLFFDAVIPQLGWSGEISKTYLLTKDSNLGAGKIGAAVVGQKIFTLAISVAALSLGLGFVLVSYPLSLAGTFLIAVVLLLSVLTLVVVFYVSAKPSATGTLLDWGIGIVLFFRRKWNPEGFRARSEAFLGQFHFGMRQLREEPKALIKPIAYAVVSFVFEVSVVFLTFVALGYTVPVGQVLIVFTLAGAVQTVGFTLFGFTEVVMTSSFAFLGIPVNLGFSVTLLSRAVNLWFRLVISYVALQWAGVKLIRNQRVRLTA
jgi:uncharacterized protein (TIRG00374 family)